MIPEHNVRIHDMNMETNLIEVLNHFSPDFVGISITTPLIKEDQRNYIHYKKKFSGFKNNHWRPTYINISR